MSSDAGALLLRETDLPMNLLSRFLANAFWMGALQHQSSLDSLPLAH
jgi:hypothetical protein